MSVTVTVVILNFNGRNYLEQFLPSVMATNYPQLGVVVADNGSTDDSVAYLQIAYPSVRILQNTKNEGFAGGYNWALQQVESDYYILLNSDVAVAQNWVGSIIALMEADKNIAACQPKILSYNHPALFEYAGAAGGWIDYLGYPFSRGRVFDICEHDKGQYNTTEPIFWASGAAMFVRAKVFHELKGFDPYFFAHQEEIDLCWRMQIAGYGIMACTDSVVYHLGAGTLPRGGRKVYLNFRNNLIMMSKNLPGRELWWKLPYRFLLDAVSAWKGLLTGEPYFFSAIVKAHIAFVYWFITRFEWNAKPKPALQSLNGVYARSVVWNYFFQSKQRFLEIISTKP